MKRKMKQREQGSDLVKRRAFLRGAAGLALGSLVPTVAAEEETEQPDYPPVRAVTRGPKHHFFAYYDKCPWDTTGRYMLAMEIDFHGRQPRLGEALTVGMIDLAEGNKYLPLDTTLAWNWQQGTMLQWLGKATDREIVYNGVEDGRFIAIVRDVHGGKTRRLPRPVYAVSNNGRQAVTLDFARVEKRRPGYGYINVPDATEGKIAPADAGIYWMDMQTGENKRIIDLAWAAGNRPDERFQGAIHWFNHMQFNPSGTRFLFLHRWGIERQPPDPSAPIPYSKWWTRLYTANPDGGDIKLLYDEAMLSHFDWRDDGTILAWAQRKEPGSRFYLIDQVTGRHTVVGEGVLTHDGHCSYSPDRKWILTDSYPNKEHKQRLILFRPADNHRIEIGQFYQPPELLHQPYRCDLHPRWNRDGSAVCIDSTHENTRQMYVVDVSRYTREG